MNETKGKHNLEYCLALADKYSANKADVIIKHGEIFEHLLDNFPNMPADWYHMETERRTKQYFRAFKGDSNVK
jgi:hypothetical protein